MVSLRISDKTHCALKNVRVMFKTIFSMISIKKRKNTLKNTELHKTREKSTLKVVLDTMKC